MCGRYIVMSDKEIEEIRNITREIDRKYGEGSMPNGEIYPTNTAPVFVKSESGYGAELMTWGFPKYQGSGVIINARAETASEKRTFSGALAARRCVIPSTGFYEWTHTPGQKKEKYLFNDPQSPVLYMAGLYTPASAAGELPRYVILTTAANDSIREIHDRMPVILRRDEIEDWVARRERVNEVLFRVPMGLGKRFVG